MSKVTPPKNCPVAYPSTAMRGLLPWGRGAPAIILTVMVMVSPGARLTWIGETTTPQSAGRLMRRAIRSIVAVCVRGLPSWKVVSLS
jgi:hypothetical protein